MGDSFLGKLNYISLLMLSCTCTMLSILQVHQLVNYFCYPSCLFWFFIFYFYCCFKFGSLLKLKKQIYLRRLYSLDNDMFFGANFLKLFLYNIHFMFPFQLFEMGLELSFSRLKALAKFAFGLGLTQVICLQKQYLMVLVAKQQCKSDAAYVSYILTY